MKKQKGGRYSVRSVEKRKKNKRDVLSYEDVPLEDYSDERTTISKSAVKQILIFAAVIIVLGLIVFAVANRDNLTPEKVSRWLKYDLLGSSDEGYPADIIGSNISDGNFICDGDLCYASDTSFVALNSVGNEIGYNQLSFSNPILTTCGEKVLIYNLGGNGYVTGEKSRLNSVKDIKEDIICGDINPRGSYCVVTRADGYLSKIYVYNNNKEKVYTYSFADYYINAVALNDSGLGCVACGVTGDNGTLSGIAYVLDFSKEEPVATYSLDDTTVYSVEYLNADTVCMVGSKSSFTLDIKAGKLNQIEYNQMQLTAFDIDPDTNAFAVSLSRSGDGRKCSVEYINSLGEIVSVNDTEYAVESLSIFKNRIAVLDGARCFVFDSEGNKVGSADAGNGAKAVRLEGTSSAYVLGINEIRKITEFSQ